MEDTTGKGPEKRIPMRAQSDNQPPHRANRMRWRQGLRDALARVNPEVEAMANRTAHLHTMTQDEEALHDKVGALVRDGRAIEFSGYRHVQGEHKYYEERVNRPASQLEILLWSQALAAQAQEARDENPDVLSGEELIELQKRVEALWDSAFPRRIDPTPNPPLVTGEEFSRD